LFGIKLKLENEIMNTQFIGILFGLSTLSFNKDENNTIKVKATGTIQQQGMTTY